MSGDGRRNGITEEIGTMKYWCEKCHEFNYAAHSVHPISGEMLLRCAHCMTFSIDDQRRFIDPRQIHANRIAELEDRRREEILKKIWIKIPKVKIRYQNILSKNRARKIKKELGLIEGYYPELTYDIETEKQLEHSISKIKALARDTGANLEIEDQGRIRLTLSGVSVLYYLTE